MDAFTSAQMNRYNHETMDRLKDHVELLRQQTMAAGLPTRFFYTEVSFDEIQASEINKFLNSMPTSLELEDVDVDKLILAGRKLLRQEPSFSAFKQAINARPADGAVSDIEFCRVFTPNDCEAL